MTPMRPKPTQSSSLPGGAWPVGEAETNQQREASWGCVVEALDKHLGEGLSRVTWHLSG